jgi:hypothetical protein
MSDNRKLPQDDYVVGYRKPPLHTRFRKGRSGNPTGGRRDMEIEPAKKLMRKEAYRLIPVRDGDRVRKISVLQAVVRSLFARAAKGSVPAQREVMKGIQDIEAQIAGNTPGLKRVRSEADVNELTDEELMDFIRAGKKA